MITVDSCDKNTAKFVSKLSWFSWTKSIFFYFYDYCIKNKIRKEKHMLKDNFRCYTLVHVEHQSSLNMKYLLQNTYCGIHFWLLGTCLRVSRGRNLTSESCSEVFNGCPKEHYKISEFYKCKIMKNNFDSLNFIINW